MSDSVVIKEGQHYYYQSILVKVLWIVKHNSSNHQKAQILWNGAKIYVPVIDLTDKDNHRGLCKCPQCVPKQVPKRKYWTDKPNF